MPQDKFNDQRKFPRLSSTVPVRFRIIDRQNPQNISEELTGQALNLSLGGMALETEINESENGLQVFQGFSVPEKNRLEIILILPQDLGEIKFIGEAVWFYFDQGEEETKFRYGINFIEFSPEALSKFSDFLEIKQ